MLLENRGWGNNSWLFVKAYIILVCSITHVVSIYKTDNKKGYTLSTTTYDKTSLFI